MTEKNPKRRSTSEERRKDLVETARQLIAEKGLEGFRTRDVAEAAGIDTGTLHYHFPSKEALIQAVVSNLAEDFRANRVTGGEVPSNAIEELRNEIFDVVWRVRKSPEQLFVMLDLTVRASRDRAVAEILSRMAQGWNEYLAEVVRRGIEQGLFRSDINPEMAAILLRAQLTGLGMVGVADPDRAEALASALSSQIQGWLSKT